MCNHKITDCFFDLYGTLVDIHTDEWKMDTWNELREEILQWGEGCHLSAEQMRDCFYWGQDYVKRFFKDDKENHKYPEIDMYPVFSYLLSQCGILPLEERVISAARVFRMASIEQCSLYDGAMGFLTKLKEGGKRVWLVTNAQRLFTLAEIERLGLDKIFDGIYISSDVGFSKPDRRIFLVPMQEHELKADQIVMIGNDGTADIAGAKACGFSTIYFRTNCSPENDHPDADLCLEGADYKRAFQWITGENLPGEAYQIYKNLDSR